MVVGSGFAVADDGRQRPPFDALPLLHQGSGHAVESDRRAPGGGIGRDAERVDAHRVQTFEVGRIAQQLVAAREAADRGRGALDATLCEAIDWLRQKEGQGNVITGAMTLPSTAYKDEQLAPFAERLLESVRRLPGVESAAVTTNVPFSGDHSDSVILAENYQMKPGESLVSPMDVIVSDGFFETMKIRLVKGRTFTPADRDGATRLRRRIKAPAARSSSATAPPRAGARGRARRGGAGR